MLTAEMLDLFGRPRGESTCACERHEEASMTQALHLINGKSLGARLASPNGRLAKVLATPNITTEQVIEELYLIVLCRMPKANEIELMMKHFQASADRTKAAQDAMWVLFNTKEFLFNH
jgi:lysozyme family protein